MIWNFTMMPLSVGIFHIYYIVYIMSFQFSFLFYKVSFSSEKFFLCYLFDHSFPSVSYGPFPVIPFTGMLNLLDLILYLILLPFFIFLGDFFYLQAFLHFYSILLICFLFYFMATNFSLRCLRILIIIILNFLSFCCLFALNVDTFLNCLIILKRDTLKNW